MSDGAGLQDQTFARFEWPKRWNNTQGPVGCLIRQGDYIVATGPMGTVWIRPEDVQYFVQQNTVFIGMLEKEVADHDNSRDRRDGRNRRTGRGRPTSGRRRRPRA